MKKLLVVFAFLLFLALLAGVAGVLLSGGTPAISGPSILALTLDRPVVDYSTNPELPFLEGRSLATFSAIYRGLERARRDDAVEGLALHVKNARLGLSKAEELLGLLDAFRESGKWVDCHLETAGEGGNGTLAYYLTSSCDRLSLTPAGELDVVGLWADGVFLRGTLDKLGIEPDFHHVGDYKSAAESFTETEHSPSAREAIGALLDDVYDVIVSAIARSRQMDPEAVRIAIDRAPFTADQALEEGLVDELAYADEFLARVRERVEGGPEPVDLVKYSRRAGGGSTRVAVVYAQGTIVRGGATVDPWTDTRYVGSDTMTKILDDLADDEGVAAVVLRIDSPGGSAVASDLIARSVRNLAAVKPVVVSMSDLAASGGYYIAADAAKIVAMETTLTGSIGVVGGKLATGRFEEEKLGITHDSLQRGANADFFSSVRPWTPEQAERYQSMMRDTYDRFVGRVAEGRELQVEEVLAVAGGRIWSGKRASELGLVDEIGGMDKALDVVREELGLEPGTALALELHPRSRTFLEMLTDASYGISSPAKIQIDLLPRPPRVPRMLELPAELVEAARPLGSWDGTHRETRGEQEWF